MSIYDPLYVFKKQRLKFPLICILKKLNFIPELLDTDELSILMGDEARYCCLFALLIARGDRVVYGKRPGECK